MTNENSIVQLEGITAHFLLGGAKILIYTLLAITTKKGFRNIRHIYKHALPLRRWL